MNLKMLLLIAQYSTWIPALIQLVKTAEENFGKGTGPHKKNWVVNAAMALISQAGTLAEQVDPHDATEIGLVVDALVGVAKSLERDDVLPSPAPVVVPQDATAVRYTSYATAAAATSPEYPTVLFYRATGNYGVWPQVGKYPPNSAPATSEVTPQADAPAFGV